MSLLLLMFLLLLQMHVTLPEACNWMPVAVTLGGGIDDGGGAASVG